MSLNALRVALQGAGFALSPISLAVQGLIAEIARRPPGTFEGPDWKYVPRAGGGPIGPLPKKKKKRKPELLQDIQEATIDPWVEEFKEIALIEDEEILEIIMGIVTSGVLDEL